MMNVTPDPVAADAAADSLETLCRKARQELKLGENFRALDRATKGLEQWPARLAAEPSEAGQFVLKLAHTKALALARLGSYAAARTLLRALPKRCRTDPEIVGALARTYKDEAFESPPDSPSWRRLLQKARQAYCLGYRASESQNYFLGVNAAACAAWLGEREGSDGANALAKSVETSCLAELERITPGSPPKADDYWTLATLGEVALLQSHDDEAAGYYAQARELVEGNQWWGDLASTRVQAQRHCLFLGRDPAPLETVLRFPCLVAFAGHMVDGPDRPTPRFPNHPEAIAAVAARLEEALRRWRQRTPVGFVVCSAAAGADLLFIEAVLAQECPAQVHVILPWEEDAFLHSSVEHGGDFWVKKFHDLKARFSTTTPLTQRTVPKLGQSSQPVMTGLGMDYCNECVIGLALHRGRALGAEVCPWALSDGRPADGPGGTASFVAFWKDRLSRRVETIALPRPHTVQGHRLVTEEEEHPPADAQARTDIHVAGGQPAIKTMLFADVAGYSKITEEQTVNFAPYFLGAVSELIALSGQTQPILSNTWGDALYMVFDEPEHGGNFALQLVKMIREGKAWRSRSLLPKDLSVRIALHTGPVLLCVDPVIRRMTFTGRHVSHAARIEPVVERGEIYASEAFVAYAELHRNSREAGAPTFGCDYLGQRNFAKNYGCYPLYRLRRECRGMQVAVSVARRPGTPA